MKKVELKILEDLESEMNGYKNPGSYQEDEWYVICRAKAEAYEDAINIVKRAYKDKN